VGHGARASQWSQVGSLKHLLHFFKSAKAGSMGGVWGRASQWSQVVSLKHLLHFFKSASAGSMGGV